MKPFGRSLSSIPIGEREARGFVARMSLGFTGVFVPLAILLAYLPLWFEHRGFDAREIGILLGVPIVARMLTTPVLLAAADRVRDRASLYLAAALLATLCSVGYLISDGFAVVLLVSVLVSVAMALAIPLSDAIALTGVRRLGLTYGPMRLWGSLAFIAATIGGGWVVEHQGVESIPWLLVGALALTAATGLTLPRIAVARRDRAAGPVRDRTLLLGFAAAALVIGSQATFYGFSSIHWARIGFSDTVIGLLWGLGVLAEIVLFAFARPLVRTLSPAGLLLGGAICGIVRWSSFTLDGGVAFYAFNSLLHAGSFAAAHLGMQQLIAMRVDEDGQGRAQALAFAMSAPVMAAATFASGWLYEAFGVDAFLGAAAMCVAALPFILPIPRTAEVQPQSSRDGGETIEPE